MSPPPDSEKLLTPYHFFCFVQFFRTSAFFFIFYPFFGNDEVINNLWHKFLGSRELHQGIRSQIKIEVLKSYGIQHSMSIITNNTLI